MAGLLSPLLHSAQAPARWAGLEEPSVLVRLVTAIPQCACGLCTRGGPRTQEVEDTCAWASPSEKQRATWGRVHFLYVDLPQGAQSFEVLAY